MIHFPVVGTGKYAVSATVVIAAKPIFKKVICPRCKEYIVKGDTGVYIGEVECKIHPGSLRKLGITELIHLHCCYELPPDHPLITNNIDRLLEIISPENPAIPKTISPFHGIIYVKNCGPIFQAILNTNLPQAHLTAILINKDKYTNDVIALVKEVLKLRKEK